MKWLAATTPLAAIALGGCSLLFPEDPREGVEAEDACIGRVRSAMTYQESEELRDTSGRYVPTFTYDITRLDLAAIKALAVPGSDETAGTRLMQGTARTRTAVERFMAMEVDERGAFFLGRSPSLYRVRGSAQSLPEILASGCARQQADMRLIDVSWERASSRPATTQSSPSSQTDR
jgi:hypothetical protein